MLSVAPAPITNPINIDRAEDGFERAALQSAMSEQGERLAINSGQSRSDITRAAESDVCLQEQALDFADQSRRPHFSPQAAAAVWVERLRVARRKHKRWGPKKLRAAG